MNHLEEQGTVQWIGLRVGKEKPMHSVTEAAVDATSGLDGDRFTASGPAHRQVTFIQQEHMDVVASLLGRESVDHSLTRRNILVSGINLLSLNGQSFRVGDCTFKCTGPCEPCQRMKVTLGPGGLDAMAGHGGILAEVLEAGTIRVGDAVTRIV